MPPAKLRLMGSLAHKSVCLGLYTRVDKKVVNGLPVWKDASGADRFIASVGSSWMCQAEASLGKDNGWLQLIDATCLSPDQSTKTWKEFAGDGKWPEAPGMRCVSADAEHAQVSRDAPPLRQTSVAALRSTVEVARTAPPLVRQVTQEVGLSGWLSGLTHRHHRFMWVSESV